MSVKDVLLSHENLLEKHMNESAESVSIISSKMTDQVNHVHDYLGKLKSQSTNSAEKVKSSVSSSLSLISDALSEQRQNVNFL